MDVDMEKEITEFCKKNHITKMMSYPYPFHSAAGKDSVLDFLVDFEPDHTPGYFGMNRRSRPHRYRGRTGSAVGQEVRLPEYIRRNRPTFPLESPG